jgi:hypothetical protein
MMREPAQALGDPHGLLGVRGYARVRDQATEERVGQNIRVAQLLGPLQGEHRETVRDRRVRVVAAAHGQRGQDADVCGRVMGNEPFQANQPLQQWAGILPVGGPGPRSGCPQER